MKKQTLLIAVSAMAVSVLAQNTNEFHHGSGKGKECPEFKKGAQPERQRRLPERDLTPEQREKMQQRRIQLLEKSLKKIGVTEEQRVQILALQKQMKESMKESSRKVDEARKNLSEIQDAGATMAEIDVAIDAVTQAQSEQLKIMVRNRMEMERILGKEKYRLFMDDARSQYRKHGQRGGRGIPERPKLPGEDKAKDPPRPETSDSQPPPPAPLA